MNQGSMVLVVINKGGVALAKKFLAQKLPADTQVIATDAIISDLLSQSKINNSNVYNIISPETEKKLYQEAVATIFSEALKPPSYKTPALKEFFNYFKAQFLYPLIELRFYDLFFKELLGVIKPKKVYLFDYTDWPTKTLKEILIKNNWQFELLPIGLIGKLKLFFISYLPFIGREKKYYGYLMAKLKLFNWLKWLVIQIKISWPKDYQPADILIGVFIYRLQIKEFAPLFEQLTNKNISLWALIDSEFSLRDCRPLIRAGVICRFVNTSRLIAAKKNETEFNFFSNSLLVKQLSEKFNWPKKYLIYQKFNEEIGEALAKTKPRLVLGLDQFYWPTGVLIKQAEARGLKTILLADIDNQMHQFDLSFLLNKNYDIFFKPANVIVLNKQLAALYQNSQSIPGQVYPAGSLKFNDWTKKVNSLNQSLDSYRANFLRRWHLPDGARIVLFTTQQYIYSFDYTKILAKALLEISQAAEFSNCYLVIKVHPLEFKWFYQLFGRYAKNKKIIITRDDDLYGLIAMAEFLVTYYSFTAIEALALGQRVLLLNFLHKNDRTTILNNPLVYQIDSLAALADQLRTLLRDKNKINRQIIIPAEIAEFLNLKANPLNSYLEIIEAIKLETTPSKLTH